MKKLGYDLKLLLYNFLAFFLFYFLLPTTAMKTGLIWLIWFAMDSFFIAFPLALPWVPGIRNWTIHRVSTLICVIVGSWAGGVVASVAFQVTMWPGHPVRFLDAADTPLFDVYGLPTVLYLVSLAFRGYDSRCRSKAVMSREYEFGEGAA